MNKTISINLGGILFHIDDEAYEVLNAWLQAVERQFLHDKERQDIMQDIEMRLSELISELINRDKDLVSIQVVNQVIGIMGEPHNFSEADEENRDESPVLASKKHKSSKRMYRDGERRILGGVCAGLGSYFSTDAWVFRVLFIAFSAFFFTGVIIYLVLWAAIPEAKTTAQKLEMKGEPINIENITNSVKEEFNRVKAKMNL